jgi:deoxyinosine 3'endonuclease (endonuclease V)
MVLGIPSIGIAKSMLVGEVEGEDEAIRRMIYDGKAVGFATGRGTVRYWSPGHSVALEELETLMRVHGPTCLRLMTESHRAAKEKARVWGAPPG